MNERIKELAEQAGFRYIKDEGIGWAGNHNASLPRFAELVRADEREACAKVCENMERNGAWITKAEAAAAIRARGEEKNNA